MSKYIDADALRRKFSEKSYYIRFWKDMAQTDSYGLTVNDINRAIDEMPAADVEPVRKWISVDERLPETRVDKEYRGGNFTGEPREVIEHTVSDQVLVAIEDWYNRIIIEIDFICDGEWDSYGERDVIAWMPLPELPKMDGGSK